MAERRRRQRDPRPPSARCSRRPATRSSTRAPTRTGRTTTRRRSRSSSSENCQIFNTFPIPPDFATFWRQAAQQGYTKHVKIAQIAKTGLFASQVDALGALGNNLASGVYWGPTWPYTSSLTGITNADLGVGLRGRRPASSGTSSSGRAWPCSTSPPPCSRRAAIRRTRPKVANAMKTLTVDTPVGHAALGQGAGAERRRRPRSSAASGSRRTKRPVRVRWVFCEHSDDPNVPIAGQAAAVQP